MTVTHRPDTATSAPVAATPAIDNELYDAYAAALYLFGDERKRQRLDKWRCAGIGPAYCKVGPRTVRYRKADLDKFILANLRQPCAGR
jgi:hypothetical protein